VWFCYIDESGTPETPRTTSHFVLLGIAIPSLTWKKKDVEIQEVKGRYDLTETEVHAAWMARRYREQERIPDFENLDHSRRRHAVQEEMKKALL
jgi:hypothetical protein